MAGLNDIILLGKSGRCLEAYNLAKADLEQGKPWAKLTTGKALYYCIKKEAEEGCYEQLTAYLDELLSLEQLTPANENTIFWIGYFAKKHLPPKAIETPTRLSALFSKLKAISFKPSKSYSTLLEGFIRCDSWQDLPEFLEWWNLDNLTPQDYQPIVIESGKTIMSIAERAYIAKSKALLRLNDLGRIEAFLPKLDTLMNQHPEMTYPGYFYGKLLLSRGSTEDEALRAILPFARKKASEFWVWQLLNDVFKSEYEKQLACLLRAVHCRTQEKFLGKVRTKLAKLYIQHEQFEYAKFQIDKVVDCHLTQGWHLPYELECLIHQPWVNSVKGNGNTPIDFLAITNAILCKDTEEAIAVVTYFDPRTKKATLIYGKEKRMTQKLHFNVGTGTVLTINYITDADSKQKILSANQTSFPKDLDFAKVVEGVVKKREEWAYAFLFYANEKAFVAPNTVNKYNVTDGETIKALVVYDYDKKKEKWNWICLSIKR